MQRQQLRTDTNRYAQFGGSIAGANTAIQRNRVRGSDGQRSLVR
jgi:hypothetical protein